MMSVPGEFRRSIVLATGSFSINTVIVSPKFWAVVSSAPRPANIPTYPTYRSSGSVRVVERRLAADTVASLAALLEKSLASRLSLGVGGGNGRCVCLRVIVVTAVSFVGPRVEVLV